MIPTPSVMQPGSPLEKVGVSADPFLTPGQQRLRQGYLKLKEEAERRGFSPASVISMQAFSWPVTGPVYPSDIKILAVPLSKEHWLTAPKILLPNSLEVPYTQHVFTEWKPLQTKYLVGQMDHEEINDSGHIWPIDQARDAVQQNGLGADRGGVFCYEGSHRPCSLKELAEKELAFFAAAHSKMMLYYEGQHEKYLDAWASRQSTNSWRDLAGKGKYHRWIAQYLHNIGRLPDLPPYCQEYTSPLDKKVKCDQCSQNVEPGSVICRHCGRVLNPFEAFSRLMIDAETPGAKLAAKRLSDSEIGLLMKDGKLDQETLVEWGIVHLKDKDKKVKAGHGSVEAAS